MATYNIVRSWNMIQGMTSPTDAHVQILRDINYRYVSIENSALRPISFAITTYSSGPTPKIQYTLKAGEIKAVAINSFGESMQYLWVLSLKGEPVGNSYPFRTDSNTFVIRDGVNKFWVDPFHFPSFRAGF